MSTTKTTTPTAVEQSQAALADALHLKSERVQAVAAAEAALQALLARLDTGDDTVTPSDTLAARESIENAGRLLAAAERRVMSARRNLRSDDTALADILAPIVKKVLHVPVAVVNERPTTAATDLPAAFLVANREIKADTIEGTVSGVVDLVFLRSVTHREADVEAIARLIDRKGVRLTDTPSLSRQERDGVITETARLGIRSAYLPLPVIRPSTHDGFRISGFARGIAQDVAASMAPHDGPKRGVQMGGNGNASARRVTVNARAGAATVVSDTTDDCGVRRRVIEVAIGVTPARGNIYGPEAMRDHLVRAIEAQADVCRGGLGRITSATAVSVVPTPDRSGRVAEARFEFTSRVPGSEGSASTAATAPVPRQADPTDQDDTGATRGKRK